MTDGVIVTPRLFIGTPKNVPSVALDDRMEAVRLIREGTTVAVPTAAAAIEVLLELGVDPAEAQFLTSPTGSGPAQTHP
jgi:hypothetical protein